MLFDSVSGKIRISLAEFVSIARRGISPTLPYDEDEPSVFEGSGKRLHNLVGSAKPEEIHFGFSAEDRDFELKLHTEAIVGSQISIMREIGSSPKKPKKEELAQVRGEAFVVGHALAELAGFDLITLKIIYSNAFSGEVEIKEETVTRSTLACFFKKCVRAVAKYATPEVERVTERLPSMKTLRFPYESVRDGQNEFIKSAYKTLSRGGVLYAAAPTGTGKTVSALYPAVRGLGDQRFSKVFYLTPKSTTAEAVRDCINLMCEKGAKIRAVILTAKEKACTERNVCRKSKKACPYTSVNRLCDAALDLYNLNLPVVSVKEAVTVSQKWGVCPYELMLSYSELSDVVCCDFNHVFDTRAYIRRFFDEGGSYALLVDEAHNLVERAREIYSDEISEDDIFAPLCTELLDEHNLLRKTIEAAGPVFRDTVLPLVKDEIREDRDGNMQGAASSSNIPDRLYTLFDELCSVAESELYRSFSAKDAQAEERVQLIRSYYYKLKKLLNFIASFDECYELFIFYNNGRINVKLYCLDPSPQIRKRINKCHGAVMFSATLSPLEYYKSVLGGERSDDVLEVPSPFDSSQLSVNIMDKVSTRYSERDDTLGAVCRVIAATVSAKRGHYMIFSPSFAYSEALAKAFEAKYPKIKIISQTKNMSADERDKFLDSFKDEDGKYLVAFCVMGGIYSEGIDLAGDSLIGAVIVGIGIPSLSYEREALTAYYNEKYDMGKQYAYIYPGMNRVFQAAGRVIRREDDKGVIVLVDDRFDDPIYKKSLPKLWRGVKFIQDAKRLREVLDSFWNED